MNTGDSPGLLSGPGESLFAAPQRAYMRSKWEIENVTCHKAAQSSLKMTENAGNEHEHYKTLLTRNGCGSTIILVFFVSLMQARSIKGGFIMSTKYIFVTGGVASSLG